MGVWRGLKNWADSPCNQMNNRSIFTRSGMSAPMTIRAMSCLVVFPVIHPTREWVSQSGILFPPFKPIGLCVESIGSEKQIQREGYRWQAAKIDQVIFPLFRNQEFFRSHLVFTCECTVHFHGIAGVCVGQRFGGIDVYDCGSR